MTYSMGRARRTSFTALMPNTASSASPFPVLGMVLSSGFRARGSSQPHGAREFAQAFSGVLDGPGQRKLRALLKKGNQLLELGARDRARNGHADWMEKVLPLFSCLALDFFRQLAKPLVVQMALSEDFGDKALQDLETPAVLDH